MGTLTLSELNILPHSNTLQQLLLPSFRSNEKHTMSFKLNFSKVQVNNLDRLNLYKVQKQSTISRQLPRLPAREALSTKDPNVMIRRKKKHKRLVKEFTRDWLPNLSEELSKTFENMTKIENFEGKRRYGFVIFKNFFSDEEIRVCKYLHKMNGAFDPKDRDCKLEYGHKVWRVEVPLKNQFETLYEKVMTVTLWTDKEYFGKIEAADYEHYWPEIEHIVYDSSKGKAFIEPHVDNDSIITIISLLSQREDFEGGVNFFEPGDKGLSKRAVQLERGDLVVFRGERLEHWITPVTEGVREIFQMELSKK